MLNSELNVPLGRLSARSTDSQTWLHAGGECSGQTCMRSWRLMRLMRLTGFKPAICAFARARLHADCMVFMCIPVGRSCNANAVQ